MDKHICKCGCDLRQNLVIVEEAQGYKATKIIGIETDPENFTADDSDESTEFEIFTGEEDEGDIYFEFECYQCDKCHIEYGWDEIKEIFA